MSVLPYLVFFISGFAALVYQVVWQRLLVIFSGSDVHSATIIVAAFMAGLGCGNLAGGHVADRVSRGFNLLAFVLAELAIALFGFFSATLYYGVLYERLGHLALGTEARAAILFVSLLWPTFFMGVSLPLLARGLTTTIGRAARVTGGLYACNTAGAAVGAFVTTWWLLPRLGLAGSLQVSATLNLAAALGALPLAFGVRASPAPANPSSFNRPAASSATEGFDAPFGLWALIYALSGFLALSLEIVWFRLMGVMLKSTAYTFGMLLSIYLAGLAGGAAIGTLLVARNRRPAHAFLILQAAVGLYAGLGLTAFLTLVAKQPSLAWVSSYFGSYEPLDVRAAIAALGLSLRGGGNLPREFLFFYVALPVVLIGPATLLMGASFPFLQKALQTDVSRVGRRVGALLSANIAGSALGSIVTGWVAIAWLGVAGTLKLLVLVSAAFPLLGLAVSWRERHEGPGRRTVWGYATITGTTALLLFAMPDASRLWSELHGSRPAWVVFGEDDSGTSVLQLAPSAETRVVVFVNGVGQSWLPYGGVHTILGALPAFIHQNPRDAALIGLGSGDTLFGMAGRRALERITCVEIIRPQLDTLRRLHSAWGYPGLDSILNDPRIANVYGDGRLHVMHAGTKYDIIEADALRPTSAYSGNLYSDRYFALLLDQLKPGGLAVTWAPTQRVHDTFVKVFPHVLSYGDIVLGSNEPIVFDPVAVRQRLADSQVQAYFANAGVDILTLLKPYLEGRPRIYTPSDDRSALVDINSDLFPKDEFGVPFHPHGN